MDDRKRLAERSSGSLFSITISLILFKFLNDYITCNVTADCKDHIFIVQINCFPECLMLKKSRIFGVSIEN